MPSQIARREGLTAVEQKEATGKAGNALKKVEPLEDPEARQVEYRRAATLMRLPLAAE